MDDFSVTQSSGGKRMKELFACNQIFSLRCSSRDWAGLPRNVLFSILNKLIVIDDCVRFGAVCRNWRVTFVEEIFKKPSSSHPPFLLIAPPPPPPPPPPEMVDRHPVALYSLSRKMVYDFRLQMLHNKVCRGSSFGWLVTLEKRTEALGDCLIQLQNPFLNRSIDLPSLDAILQQHPEPEHSSYKFYLHKAVLSSDPISSPDNFVVMAIMSKYYGLAFFKPGNTTWTSVGDDWYTHWNQCDDFRDLIFFHKTNQFYAGLTSGAVLAVDFLGDEAHPKLTQIAPPISGHPHVMTYLVEDLSSGDLFQVFKAYDDPKRFSRTKRRLKYNRMTVDFTVFKFNTTEGNWIEVDELGQNVIFLGKSASMLRPTSECPGCEPNCIYYTDDDNFNYRSNVEHYAVPRDGIYHLKLGLLGPHYSSGWWSDMSEPQQHFWSAISTKILPQAIWLQPTLRHCN